MSGKPKLYPSQISRDDDPRFAFQGSSPDHRVEVLEELDYSVFEIDPKIQRDERPAEINRIVKRFNANALGVFTVSVRDVDLPDGKTVTKWFLVDGQQRRAALTRLKWGGKVRAIVHYNLTLAEEAQLFLDLNERDVIDPWGRFKSRLVAEEPQAMAIKEILDDLGIALGGTTGFSAITRADRIYSKNSRGPANLRWALQMLKDTYSRYDGRVMEALAMIYDEYPNHVDSESLRAKLQHNAPTISKVTGSGKLVQQLYHCTVSMGVAEAIIAIYNKHTRRSGKTTSALPSLLNKRRKPSLRDKEDLAGLAADDDIDADEFEDEEIYD